MRDNEDYELTDEARAAAKAVAASFPPPTPEQRARVEGLLTPRLEHRPGVGSRSMVDGWTVGADVGAMLTGLSALTAASTWVAGRVREWRREKAQTRLRNWHAYIDPTGINQWYVRLAEDPQTATGKVTLEVLPRPDGEPDAGLAYNMRQVISRDGALTRAPTLEEYDFLIAQRKARFETGFPVGLDQSESPWPPFS